jgi:plasmid stability protein
MATLTLKNVPEDLVERLKQEAAQNRRSLNQETLARLERTLGPRHPTAEEALAILRRVHEQFAGIEPLTDEFLDLVKNDGRP